MRSLNQYSQRAHPLAVRVHAPEHVGVIVNSERTERTDGDFYAPATGDNSTASVELDIVVKALDPGPPELLAEESRTALLPQDPESFTDDLDGNLTQDGPGYAFGYTFDDIGNRTQTVFNERSAAYTSDTLNQYTHRDYSGAVDAREAPRPEESAQQEASQRVDAERPPGKALTAKT